MKKQTNEAGLSIPRLLLFTMLYGFSLERSPQHHPAPSTGLSLPHCQQQAWNRGYGSTPRTCGQAWPPQSLTLQADLVQACGQLSGQQRRKGSRSEPRWIPPLPVMTRSWRHNCRQRWDLSASSCPLLAHFSDLNTANDLQMALIYWTAHIGPDVNCTTRQSPQPTHKEGLAFLPVRTLRWLAPRWHSQERLWWD